MAKKNNSEALTTIEMMVVRPAKIQGEDIGTWRDAVNSAKLGYRAKYYNLCENLLADPILSDALDRRVQAITNAEIAFLKDGESVEEIEDLIDTPEFEELLGEIVLSKAYGKSVIIPSFYPEFKVFSVPRKHIRIDRMERPLKDRRRYILEKEGDFTGYEYSNDPFVIECGKDDDLGFLFKAAPYVIYKRGDFGDWAQFAEIFGMPFIIGKYSGLDKTTRDALFKALEEIGSNPRAAIPKEAEIELHDNKSTGSSSLYKALKDACNEEILIAVLGNLMTTLNGSSRSQSEIHQDTQQDINKADRRYVQRILNKKLVPLLVKRGYPAAGGSFSFPDAGESLSTSERLDMAIKLKNEAKVPIDDDYFYEITGVPKAKGTTAKKEKKPKPEKEEKTDPVPKTRHDLSYFFAEAPVKGALDRFLDGLRSFFVPASFSDYSIDFEKLFKEALNDIYSGDTAPVNGRLFDIINGAVQSAFTVEFGSEDEDWGKGNAGFIEEFRKNGAYFAGFEAFGLTEELLDLVYGPDGKQKTFKQFKTDSLAVKETEERYLGTQYNTALKTTRAAINYRRYLDNERLYPNLEYLESTAKNKRTDHLAYVGTILPVRHPWWLIHLPPGDWNCQCRVKPTNKKATAVPFDEEPVDPVFANNPGMTAKFLVHEETSSYKNVAEAALREAIEEFAARAEKIRRRLENVEFDRKSFKSGGYLDIPKQGQSSNETKKNVEIYTVLAKKHGQKYALLPISEVIGKKNPDAVNLKYYIYSDAKAPVTPNGKNAVQNSVKAAAAQKVSEVVIRADVSFRDLKNGLKAALQNGRAKTIKTIVIIDKNGDMKVFDADRLRDVRVK